MNREMKKYTAQEFLKAAEIGEVSMIDAKHIVSLLDEARRILRNAASTILESAVTFILCVMIAAGIAHIAYSQRYVEPDHSPPTIPISDTVDHWAIWTEALIEVESGGDDYAVGRTNDWGCLQITPVLVREVNRIQSERKFSMNDAKDRNKSIEMYNIIQAYYNPGHDRHLALKIWNPRAPVSYHKRVEEEYNKLIRITKGE